MQPALPGRVKSGIRRFFTRRDFKDRLFVKLFHDKTALLELYNALNGTDYENPDELMITTIDDAVYMGFKNDCSFIVGNYLNLYEQQSTFCPNMPIRGLIYIASIFTAYISRQGYNLYGTALIRLPAPRYIVFYNGTEERPEQETLRLSDAFEGKDACLECTALMLNINKGHNQELMEKCRELGADREGTVKQLMDKYSLSREAAEETAGRYW